MMPMPSRRLFNFGKKNLEEEDKKVKLIAAPSNLWTEDGLETMYGK
jgi:hypothetical protein